MTCQFDQTALFADLGDLLAGMFPLGLLISLMLHREQHRLIRERRDDNDVAYENEGSPIHQHRHTSA